MHRLCRNVKSKSSGHLNTRQNARSRKIYSSLLELVSLRVHHPSSYAEIQLDWSKVTGLGKILHSVASWQGNLARPRVQVVAAPEDQLGRKSCSGYYYICQVGESSQNIGLAQASWARVHVVYAIIIRLCQAWCP